MKYLSGLKDFNFKETAVALGNFDGIHKGHQLLIQEVLLAKERNLTSVIFTFDPHPSFVLSHKEPVDLIFVKEERVSKFKEMGIDLLIEYPFTMETAKMSPIMFIEEVLVKRLDVKIIIIGSDYRFGYKREGDVDLLKAYAKTYGYEVKVIEKKTHQSEIISSSKIRELIKSAHIEAANDLLGEPFLIKGKVQHGKKIGRTFGIPTANIIPREEKLLPPNGVYITKTRVDRELYYSVTNIGHNPTTGYHHKVVETYLLDVQLELYDQDIDVLLLKYLRDEEKFATIEELINQIQQDIEETKDFFLRNPDL